MHTPNFQAAISQLRHNYQGLMALRPEDVMQFKAQFEGLTPAGRQFIQAQISFWQLQVNASILEELRGIADILEVEEPASGAGHLGTAEQGFVGGENMPERDQGTDPMPELERDREAEHAAASKAAAAIMAASGEAEAVPAQSTPVPEDPRVPQGSGASSRVTSSPASPPLQGELMLGNLLGQ